MVERRPFDFTIRDASDALQSISPRAGRDLRESLIEAHGPAMGAVLFDAEIAARSKTADAYRKLKAELDAATAAVAAKVAEVDIRLVPLQRAMDNAYGVWLCACEALESQRISNQQEVMPLQEKVSALIATINKPLHANRVKQWAPAEPGSFPMPRPDLD